MRTDTPVLGLLRCNTIPYRKVKKNLKTYFGIRGPYCDLHPLDRVLSPFGYGTRGNDSRASTPHPRRSDRSCRSLNLGKGFRAC
jgi:hypothetical protein